jgi:hypothetical protein
MNSKKCKRIRKQLGYSLRDERKEGRKYFTLNHKIEKDKDGNEKICGIVCDKLRRTYKIVKKYS